MTPADQTHEERALPRRRFLSLRVVLWLTVPPLLLAAYLVTAATIDYREARQYDDW